MRCSLADDVHNSSINIEDSCIIYFCYGSVTTIGFNFIFNYSQSIMEKLNNLCYIEHVNRKLILSS